MISSRCVTNCIAFGLALLLVANGLLADETWTITTPETDDLYASTSNIAGSGSANTKNDNYTCSVIQAGVTMNSNNGTSGNGLIPPYTWSCTVDSPTGGWTKNSAATFKIVGAGGGSASVTITISP